MKKLLIFPVIASLLSLGSCQSMGGHSGTGMIVIAAIFVIALLLFVAAKMMGKKRL